MEGNRDRIFKTDGVRVEVTDLSISFAFKSVRIFYTIERKRENGEVDKQHKNKSFRGEKFLNFITRLTQANQMALEEVKETEGLNGDAGNNKATE